MTIGNGERLMMGATVRVGGPGRNRQSGGKSLWWSCAAILAVGLLAAPTAGAEAVEFSKHRLEWQPQPAAEDPPLVLEMQAWLKPRKDWQPLSSTPDNRYAARASDIIEANKSTSMDDRVQVWAPSERADLRERMRGRLESTASVMRAISETRLGGAVRYGPYVVLYVYSVIPQANNIFQPFPMKEIDGTLYLTNELGTGDAMFSSIRTALVRHWGLDGETNAMPTFCGC